MRRGSFFWGVVLIVLGVLFFLQARGLITDVMGWFWPVAFILAGLWVLGSRYLPYVGGSDSDTFSTDLQGAANLNIEFNHGAGSVSFTGGAPAGVAVNGLRAAGMDVKSHLSSDNSLSVTIDAGPTFIPFLGPDGGEWKFQLTNDIPVAIKADSGASSMDFDLTDVRLTYLGVNTGASTFKVKLPVNAGHTLVDVESGAATIEMIVPQGVGARIRIEQGASSVKIDEQRFPVLGGNSSLRQSADYDTAANQVEISLEGGANTVRIY